MSFISGSTEETVRDKASTEIIIHMIKRFTAADEYESSTAAKEAQEGLAETAVSPSKIFLNLLLTKVLKLCTIYESLEAIQKQNNIALSPSGKATDSDSVIPRFESW